MPDSIVVKKLNQAHELMWSYTGRVIEQSPTRIKLEARFNRETTDFGYAVFEKNDRFVEWFFADRWYNIFEIHSVQDDHLKGWYCNIVQPALFQEGEIAQVDLALDVWIAPNGSARLLDEDEFAALMLDAQTHAHARQAVTELLGLVQQRVPPFDYITHRHANEGPKISAANKP
ncbi:MAG TPA: DUF402 domain-containing protein [Anaerolineae bacterium]